MHLDHILGIAVICVAYGTLWYFVLYGRKIIENIDRNNYKNLREIKKALGMRKERNG